MIKAYQKTAGGVELFTIIFFRIVFSNVAFFFSLLIQLRLNNSAN
jgi:hypothetical protein